MAPKATVDAAVERVINEVIITQCDENYGFLKDLKTLLTALDEASKDTERLDKLEKEVSSSGYYIELRGCSIPQSNAVVINTACGSGPFQKQIIGSSGHNPLRQAIDAMKERGE